MTNAVIGALRVNLGMDTAEFETGAKRGEVVWGRFGKTLQAGTKDVQAAQGSISNLAAQFQDIGVQLAGGQSPLLIALQQGGQITQVLGQNGAAGAVGLLSSAFASLISPVSLVTIGLIAAGGIAIQYFGKLLSDSGKAELTLEEQATLIQQVAKNWGDAVPALKEYADQLDRAKNAGDLRQAVDIRQAEEYATINKEFEKFNDQYDEYYSVLIAAGNATGSQRTLLSDLGTAYADLEQKIEKGTAKAEDFQRVQQLATQVASTEGAEEIKVFGEAFDELIGKIQGALNRLAALRAAGPAIAGLFPSRGAYDNVSRSADGPIEGQSFPLPEQGPLPERRPLIELTGMDWLPQSRSGGTSEAEKQAKAYDRVVTALRDELSTLNENTTAQRILQQQRRAGVDATSAQGVEIAQLVTKLDEEKQRLRDNAQVAQFFQNSMQQAFSDIIPDIETGNKALDRFLNTLIQATAQGLLFGSGPLASLFGGGTVGNSGSSGGLLGSIFKGLIGFANGGTILPGGTGGIDSQVVAFRKSPSEQVDIYDPRKATRSGNPGDMQVSIVSRFDADGGFQSVVEGISYSVAQKTSSAAIGQYDKALPGRISDVMDRNG